jgi:hypothetical protein
VASTSPCIRSSPAVALTAGRGLLSEGDAYGVKVKFLVGTAVMSATAGAGVWVV